MWGGDSQAAQLNAAALSPATAAAAEPVEEAVEPSRLPRLPLLLQ